MSKALLANLLITWLLLPYAAAFLGALLPRLARWFALLSGLVTLVVGAWCLMGGSAALDLIGPLGVLLRVDGLAAPFLLLNALVLLAVLAERWRRLPEGPFLVLLPLLLGGLNATAVAVDLVSLYVALEVVGITAFLLILRNRDAGQLWIALRYLLVGNSVMTLYLVGVALLYLQSGSFRFSALAALPPADPARAVILALVLVGLFTKGGLFLSGLWLPQTHAEAPADVSALLSGMAVAGGLCPLLRLAEQLPFLQPLLAWLGLASAVLGLVYALMESDLKRLLAWSTLSQVGLVVIHPPVVVWSPWPTVWPRPPCSCWRTICRAAGSRAGAGGPCPSAWPCPCCWPRSRSPGRRRCWASAARRPCSQRRCRRHPSCRASRPAGCRPC